MQKAVSYIRISTEDQSNWSISGQIQMNESFAQARGIEIEKTFTDDGVSAKDFNRPAWKKCIEYIISHKGVEFLIIAKYDRLIRNASEGLAMIEKLENKYNIKILSVQENFFVDPYSPYFFKMRADLLVNAEFERRVISDRSKFGVWSARSQGRFIGQAPFGYKNSRDEQNKPIIEVVEEEARVIRQIFQWYLSGYSLQETTRMAKEIGFTRKGKNALTRIIENPTYCGKIAVPAWKEKLTFNVLGIHEAIITEQVWEAAFHRLHQKLPSGPKKYREEVPLRGLLYCGKCGHICTGGKTKGRNQYYWYYRCSNLNCNTSYNAVKVEADIKGIMYHLSIPPEAIPIVASKAKQKLKTALSINSDRIKSLEKEIQTTQDNLDMLEHKFITDMISADTYKKWSQEYSEKIYQLRKTKEELNVNVESKIDSLNKKLALISNLGNIYETSSPQNKYRLLKGCSKYGLMIGNNKYETPELNPIFLYKSLEGSKLHVDKKLILEGKMLVRSISTRNNDIYQTIFEILEKKYA